MMSDNFFAYISRMRYIGRWSLMRNSLPENIQEHSHMAAVIAHALGVIRRRLPGTPRRSSHIIIFKQYNTSRCVLLQPHLISKFLNFFQTKTTNMTVLALSLFVFWILADYSDASFSFNDFAFFTDRFNR